MYDALQEARDVAGGDRPLIVARDQAYDLTRRAELLHEDLKNGLDFAIAWQAEQQAEHSHQMSVAAYRLNILAAFFFPIATLMADGNKVLDELQDRRDTIHTLLVSTRDLSRQLTAALKENRFRLVQQPIASLVGEDLGMFDVLVRMLDEQGQEVLPSVFMPAAERNDLMKHIDRWVIGAAMSFCAARKPGALFVRLSQDTLADAALPAWLGENLKKVKIEPARIVFQIREESAAQQIKEAVALHKALSERGFRFALEGFGMGRDTEQLLKHLKPDFVKIHGALMQGLSADQDKQARVKAMVELARKCKAVTIGERVQDANTMAVLWQLGVEFIQGYFVNAPEEVVLG